MSRSRQRLDKALVERGLVANRSRARALVMAGQVKVAGHPAAKSGEMVGADDRIEVSSPPRFVSRGGDKLEPALRVSEIDVTSAGCVDIGASTGGFTDCLLQAGAAFVVAVDVGYGQLDWRLRQDERVFAIERTNARYMAAEDLPALPAQASVLVVDVAFISLAKILPNVSNLCPHLRNALVLVKPQFEAGPEHVGSGGVVTDAGVRRRTLSNIIGIADQLGWQTVRAIPSPLRGPSGNWECFLQLRRPPGTQEFASLDAVLDDIEIPEG